MKLTDKMIFDKKDLLINKKNKLVCIYNKKKCKHFILSEEVYDFFEKAVGENITFKEFISYFKNEEDKKYIKRVIDNLIKLEVFYSESLEDKEEKSLTLKSIDNIYITLTKRCNLNCTHCSTSCSNKEKDFLSTEQIKKMVDKIKRLNPKVIILTGGEPLIRSDFKEIVMYIRENLENVFLGLSTNGTLICKNNIDFIVKNFDKVDISIDGVDEETCSITRGKGVFNKVISVVKQLQLKGFSNIHLSMIFEEKNMHLSEEFNELNKKLGTTPIERTFIPEGRGADNVLEYCLEDFKLPVLIPKILESQKNIKSKKISSCACNALKGQIFIDHNGSIYPCPSLMKKEYKVGNIYDKDIILNIQNLEVTKPDICSRLEDIKPYNFEKCKDCDVNIFCWHCPALIDGVKNNDKELNNWCNLMKPLLNKIIWDEDVI